MSPKCPISISLWVEGGGGKAGKVCWETDFNIPFYSYAPVKVNRGAPQVTLRILTLVHLTIQGF